jgi:hypothetical protein
MPLRSNAGCAIGEEMGRGIRGECILIWVVAMPLRVFIVKSNVLIPEIMDEQFIPGMTLAVKSVT